MPLKAHHTEGFRDMPSDNTPWKERVGNMDRRKKPRFVTLAEQDRVIVSERRAVKLYGRAKYIQELERTANLMREALQLALTLECPGSEVHCVDEAEGKRSQAKAALAAWDALKERE